MATSIIPILLGGCGDDRSHSSYSSLIDGEMTTPLPTFKREEKDLTLRRNQNRQGWSPPFLILFLEGDREIATTVFLFRGWGGRHHPPNLREKKILVQEEKTKRGLASSIFIIFP